MVQIPWYNYHGKYFMPTDLTDTNPNWKQFLVKRLNEDDQAQSDNIARDKVSAYIFSADFCDLRLFRGGF